MNSRLVVLVVLVVVLGILLYAFLPVGGSYGIDEFIILKNDTGNTIKVKMLDSYSEKAEKEVYPGKEERFSSKGNLLVIFSSGKYMIFNDIDYNDVPTEYHRLKKTFFEKSWSFKLALDPKMDLYALSSTSEIPNKNKQPYGYPKIGKELSKADIKSRKGGQATIN